MFFNGENSPKKLQTLDFYCTHKCRAEPYQNDFHASGDALIFRIFAAVHKEKLWSKARVNNEENAVLFTLPNGKIIVKTSINKSMNFNQ